MDKSELIAQELKIYREAIMILKGSLDVERLGEILKDSFDEMD